MQERKERPLVHLNWFSFCQHLQAYQTCARSFEELDLQKSYKDRREDESIWCFKAITGAFADFPPEHLVLGPVSAIREKCNNQTFPGLVLVWVRKSSIWWFHLEFRCFCCLGSLWRFPFEIKRGFNKGLEKGLLMRRSGTYPLNLPLVCHGWPCVASCFCLGRPTRRNLGTKTQNVTDLKEKFSIRFWFFFISFCPLSVVTTPIRNKSLSVSKYLTLSGVTANGLELASPTAVLDMRKIILIFIHCLFGIEAMGANTLTCALFTQSRIELISS